MNIDDRINGKTRLLGVIGNPVAHTVSPQLHNTLAAAMEVNAAYVPLPIPQQKLQDAVAGLRALNVAGFNVTVPYKEQILPLLDEITDEARLIGAVNTVRNQDGKLTGYNTDAAGFYRSFQEEFGSSFQNKRIAVLGAGGAARAVCIKMAMEGAADICILNRTVDRAQALAEAVNRGFPGIAGACPTEEGTGALETCDIVVNTTSVGMHPLNENCPIGEKIGLRPEQLVYDLIYNPSETLLLQRAKAKGCRIANGVGMLFYQGIHAFEIWTGLQVEASMARELFSAFKAYIQRQNA